MRISIGNYAKEILYEGRPLSVNIYSNGVDYLALPFGQIPEWRGKDTNYIGRVDFDGTENPVVEGDNIIAEPATTTEIETYSQNIINKEKLAILYAYLADTDWYAVRKADTGEDIPADITKARQEARDEISVLREVV